ncbi:MAG: zinc dependent phospholipase C family protein [Chitinophagaceae bacterium]
MKQLYIIAVLLLLTESSFCWGFYGHRKINYYAVFLLPPEMLLFYKKNIAFISEHAVDPDKRRYAIATEGPRHYIDLDHYGQFPWQSFPHQWKEAVDLYSEDTLLKHGIAPWWIQTMLYRLTDAFREKNQIKILRLSAEIGHYIGDAHVPLHTSSNHNGQLTNQRGIHGFWESRIPELLAEKEWDFFIGKAEFIKDPLSFTWKRILESAAAADTVLTLEKRLSNNYPADQKFSFEERNGILVRQYASSYAKKYNNLLNNMVERRMQQSIFAVASFWFTAWVNAGQPDLKALPSISFSDEELKEMETLNKLWKEGTLKGRECY